MKTISTLILFLLCLSLSAQDITKTTLNTVSIQALGSGGISISAKYDRILVNKPGFKLAQSLGYTPAYDFEDSPAWFSEANIILGKKKHHLETGLGLALIQYYKNSDFWLTNNEIKPSFNLGYRFQDFSEKGITFSLRAHLYDRGPNEIWAGTTLGYSF